MIRTLDRYIIRSFLHSYVLCLAIMIGLRLAGDLFVNVDEFAELKDLGWSGLLAHVASYYSANSLLYFQELAGVILTASAAFSLARMNHSNELTAVLASGTSIYRVILPVVLTAMVLSGLSAVNQELLIPRVKQRLALGRDELPETVRLRVHLLHDGRRQVWYSENYYGQEQRMVQPLILARDERYALTGRLSGREAHYAGNGRWRLTDGVVVRPGAGRETITARFLPTTLTLADLAGAAERARTMPQGDLLVEAQAADPRTGLVSGLRAKVLAGPAGSESEALATVVAELAVAGRRGNQPGFYLLGPAEVMAEQLVDLPALCRRLADEGRRGDTDNLPSRLWTALPASARKLALSLAELTPEGVAPADAAAMAEALTAAVHSADLARPGDVPGAVADQRAWRALPQEARGRLNRLGLDLLAGAAIAPAQGDVLVETDLTPEEMTLRQHGDWVELMSISEINRLLASGKAPDPASADLAKHLRIATPVINLVMMLVGIPFILSRERNIRASASLSVAMAVAVYVVALLCRQLGGAGLDPALAAWGPVLIFGPVAVWVLDSVKT